ncbi:MAG: toll/interleukin-1 receptor domain-containing protein [Limnohabitans sp.]
MTIPKVFISYSHDSQDHKKWVLELAIRLRNNGVDAILDQWDLKPGDDLPRFMEQGLMAADRVLMVCTDKYVEKANASAGGVGYEKMIVTADLLKTIDSNKVIPLICQSGNHNVPTFLRSKRFLDFSRQDQFEFSFDELIRTLHNAPLYEKPAIANNPFTPVKETPPNRTGDGVLEVMKLVVAQFERQTSEYITYGLVVKQAQMSRIMFDLYIAEANSEGLITQDHDKDIRLTTKGKHYAIQHQIIRA